MLAEQVMTADVRVCAPNDDLAKVAGLMWDYDCGCVPVVDASERVVGMITDRDACMAAYTKGRPLAELIVSDAMASNVITCKRSDTTHSIEQLMADNQIRRIPVVDDDGRIAGIVSLNDLARASARPPSRGGQVDQRHVALTLAATAAPRSSFPPPNGSASTSRSSDSKSEGASA